MTNEKKAISALIVDDETELCELLTSEVQDLSYTAHSAFDGLQALSVLEKESINIVISDIRMPRMGGIELLSKIREKYGAEPIVVFMSGYSDIPIWEIFDRGAQGFLGKPFLMDDLRNLITKLLTPIEQRWQVEPKGKPVSKFESVVNTPNGFSLGTGGFFINQSSDSLQRGDLVQFGVSLDGELKKIEGTGIVKWTRQPNKDLLGGCGIEFEYLTESCRQKVIAAIKSQKSKKHIPMS